MQGLVTETVRCKIPKGHGGVPFMTKVHQSEEGPLGWGGWGGRVMVYRIMISRERHDNSVQGKNILELAGDAEDVLIVELCMKKLKGENKTRQHANSQQRDDRVKEHAAWHHGSILWVTCVVERPELETDGRQERCFKNKIQVPFPKKMEMFDVLKWNITWRKVNLFFYFHHILFFIFQIPFIFPLLKLGPLYTIFKLPHQCYLLNCMAITWYSIQFSK